MVVWVCGCMGSCFCGCRVCGVFCVCLCVLEFVSMDVCGVCNDVLCGKCPVRSG